LQFPISGQWAAAIIALIVLVGSAVLYVGNLRTDIAVTAAELRSLQKEHATWADVMREQIRKLEDGVERRLGDLERAIRGRLQEPPKP
jgi:hypothetical protein